MNYKGAWDTTKTAGAEFSQDRVLRLSAATAYYAIFSIGPLLVLVVGIAGLIFGQQAVQREVHQQIQSLVGKQSAALVASMMGAQQQGGSLVATILGAIALVFGATGVFAQLQDSLNTIWSVTPKPDQGMWAMIRERFLSIATVLGIGFLLLVSMALSAFVNTLARFLGGLVSLPGWVIVLLNGLLSFLVVAALFALIFKLLPDVRIQWRDVWVGAITTAALFTLGKYLLGLYMAHELNPSAYGTGGALVVILMYVYYASVILYFGAELTKVFAKRRGARIQPSAYAMHLTEEQRADQGVPTQKQVEDLARQQQKPSQAGNTQNPSPRTDWDQE